MNPLEIYRLLPGTNCGECNKKTCMAFAVNLKNNVELLDECRYITDRNREIIREHISEPQWQDELIQRLKGDVSRLDFSEIYKDLGCELKEKRILIRCIGRVYEISNDGKILPEPEIKWITILLLHYLKTRGSGDFTNEWISFSDIKGGSVKSSTFERDCVEPLRELFDADTLMVMNILRRLGASEVDGMPSEYSIMFDIVPKIRILILYDERDDEFPSSLKILFDKVTDRFLDVESIIFLCEGLVHTLKAMMRKENNA